MTSNPTQSAEAQAERPHARRSSSQLGSLALCRGFRPLLSKKVHWVTAQGIRGHAALDSGDDENLESEFEEKMYLMCEAYCAKLPLASREFQEIKVDTIEGRFGYTDRLRIRAEITESGKVSLGTNDVPFDSDEADLVDWKFVKAHEVVDAEFNLQGKDYVLGIFEDPQFSFLKKIHVHFVMPRFESVTTHTFTREDIPSLQLEIFAVLARARETDGQQFKGEDLNPSYDNCRYCGMAGNCVALRRIADRLGRAYDPDGYGKSPAIPEETHAALVASPEARGQLQELAGLMEVFTKSTRLHNLSMALENPANAPAGYVVDWRKGRRYVTSPARLLDVVNEFGLKLDDLLDAAQFSWTKLEEKLKAKAPHGSKASIVAEFDQKLLELEAAARPESTPCLKRT